MSPTESELETDNLFATNVRLLEPFLFHLSYMFSFNMKYITYSYKYIIIIIIIIIDKQRPVLGHYVVWV